MNQKSKKKVTYFLEIEPETSRTNQRNNVSHNGSYNKSLSVSKKIR